MTEKNERPETEWGNAVYIARLTGVVERGYRKWGLRSLPPGDARKPKGVLLLRAGSLARLFQRGGSLRGKKDWLLGPSRRHCFQEHCKGLKPQALTELYPPNPQGHPAGVGFPAGGLFLGGVGCG